MFTHRLDYDRERNLELVCDALNRGWGLGLSVNKHHDIVLGGHWKVCLYLHGNNVSHCACMAGDKNVHDMSTGLLCVAPRQATS